MDRASLRTFSSYARWPWVLDVQGRVLSANQFGKNNNVSATVPLIVGIEEDGDWSQPWTAPIRRCYYFWFFGYVAKLPFERELPPLSLKQTIRLIDQLSPEPGGRPAPHDRPSTF